MRRWVVVYNHSVVLAPSSFFSQRLCVPLHMLVLDPRRGSLRAADAAHAPENLVPVP